MKKSIYILLLAVLACSCREDDILDSQVRLDNLYTITDDPNDPVKHRIYGIYEKYGVPVYFNDTIGQVQMSTDVHGNPYYRYETLDLGWDFNKYEKLTYRFDYITDPERQYEMLDAVEYYLENTTKPLWPHSFFIAEHMETVSRDGQNIVTPVKSNYKINFRVISLMPGNWPEEAVAENIMDDLKRTYVSNKVTLFKEELEEFGNYSKEYYSIRYENLLEQHTEVKFIPFGPGGFSISIYSRGVSFANGTDLTVLGTFAAEDGEGNEEQCTRCPSVNALLRIYYGTYVGRGLDPSYTEDELEMILPVSRYVLGTFGFLSSQERATQGSMLSYSPKDSKDDMLGYLGVILKTPADEFRQTWGSYPLVMYKFEILYRLLTEKIGLDL